MKKFKIIITIFCMFIIPKITTNAMNKNIFKINLAKNIDEQNQQENEDIPNESISAIANDYEIEDQEALLAEEEERLENSNSNLEEEIEDLPNENIIATPIEYENFNNNEYENFNNIEDQKNLLTEEEMLKDSNSNQIENEDKVKNDEETTIHYEENLKFLVESTEKLIED